MPSFSATSSRVMPDASIQLESLVSRLRGLPRERFGAAAIDEFFVGFESIVKRARETGGERTREKKKVAGTPCIKHPACLYSVLWKLVL